MRYVIVKTSAYGDVVQTFPVLEYLKSRGNHIQVDWIVEEDIAPLVHAHPAIDTVIVVRTKKWKKEWYRPKTWKEIITVLRQLRRQKYNALFDLQGNAKSAMLTWVASATHKIGFGWQSASERINCLTTHYRTNPPRGQNVRRDYLSIVQHYFKDQPIEPISKTTFKLTSGEKKQLETIKAGFTDSTWIVCVGTKWKNKQLAEKPFHLFLEEVYREYSPSFVFIYGSLAEKVLAEEFTKIFPHSQVLGNLSLPLLQHVMQYGKLIMAMDSLPLHLAATTHTPTFSFFGPTQSSKFRPLGEEHFSFQGSCPYGYRFEKQCPKLRSCPTGACLHDVNPMAIKRSFDSFWNYISK